jgi:uncharacterized membrane protein
MTNTTIKWVFTAEGLAFAALGLPLALGSIPPNGIYGFRTAKTLSDPKIWITVNRSMGMDLVIAGLAIVIAAFIISSLLRTGSANINALVNVCFDAVVILVVVLRGFLRLRGLG